ncbi:hypothetical protein MLD38_017595 [Melastoma candidum]|uniref:Uncharacterized protein n=1 Tax=Melastoma candidum TaxID=119954 RepID=A0ACB9QRN2_9MYRT|nr:hypothetical protein MLD38_017595 [Melastoma candidum]
MTVHCDLQIHINGHHTFFLHESVITTYCGKLKKVVRQERKKGTQIKTSEIGIPDFPGGPVGFELVSLFCYNGGNIPLTESNVALLYCSAVFLGMTEKVSSFNLIKHTEMFLENVLEWPWTDVVTCLRSTEPFLRYADSVGLVERLVCALLAKIAQSSDVNSLLPSLSSSSSSPDTNPGVGSNSSGRLTPKSVRPSSSNAWWFEGLAVLSPEITERIVKSLGAYGEENNSLILTNFLLHYLKRASQIKSNRGKTERYAGLADTAVHGVITAGKSAFTCRGLFKVLRIVSSFGLSKDCRIGLEGLIGGMLDQASLDDVLVSGHERGQIYDVNLVARLIRVFVGIEGTCSSPSTRMRKVGWLVDNYLGEIAPDPNLKMSKFIGVAESLPDSARECFDGVYRAIDIYLESHPSLSFEERSRLFQCLNYEKLSLEACKELAKNPKVPPLIAIQALMAQQSHVPAPPLDVPPTPRKGRKFIVATKDSQRKAAPRADTPSVAVYDRIIDTEGIEEENQEMRTNLERMQWRVIELEKVCKEMKGQMSRMVPNPASGGPGAGGRALPRLC